MGLLSKCFQRQPQTRLVPPLHDAPPARPSLHALSLVLVTRWGGRPAPPDKSLAFLLPPVGLYCFPRKLRRAIWAGLCAGRGVRPSATAVYLCCLLCATASLTLSTECNCFSTRTTAARQVCFKHPLIKSLPDSYIRATHADKYGNMSYSVI